MQKGQALIFILLGIVMIAFVGMAFYAGKITPKPPSQVAISTPLPTPFPSPVDASPAPAGVGETANWERYISKRGYSFQYPQNMSSVKPPSFELQISNKDLLITVGFFGLGTSYKSIDDYVRYGFCLSTPTHETINKKTVYLSERVFTAANICEDGVFSLKDNWIVDFQGKAYNQNGVMLYKQIISTFKPTQ